MDKKLNLRLSTETQQKIDTLVILDYKKQLVELKKNKSNYDYAKYRYKYIRLYNAIKWYEGKSKRQQ